MIALRAAIGAALLVLLASPALGAAPSAGAAPAIAVLGVGEERQSPELQARQRGLVHLVQSELVSRSAARIASRSQTSLLLEELGMTASQLTEAATSQRFGQAVSADYLVLLHVSGEGRLSAEVTVEGVARGEQTWSGRATGAAEDLPALAAEVADALLRALRLSPAATAATAERAPVLAVLDFRSEGAPGALDTHLPELADLLSANLTALEAPLVERRKLASVFQELGLSASVRAADVAKVGRLLGAERMLDTSLIVSGKSILLDGQLIEPETGLVVATCRARGAASAVPAVIQELATRVAHVLHVSLTDAGRSNLAQQTTGSLEAAFHAAVGWRLASENQSEAAVKELQQAVYLDPGLASAWRDLASQYEALGDHKQWAECARRFFAAAEGKAEAETFAAMAEQLANAEMWQKRYPEEEAAARLGLSYEPRNPTLHERLIIAMARQGKAREVQAHCEDVYEHDTPPYELTHSLYVYAIHWLGYPQDPADYSEEAARVDLELISRGLDLFGREPPTYEFRFGIVMKDALVYISGAATYGGGGITLRPPLRHGEECLKLAQRMTTHNNLPWTSGRGWFVVGLIEYKLGHGKEAEAALLRCLTYSGVNFDFDSYGYLAPAYGQVYYLLGHTYQDLLHDRDRAIASYQQACFWTTRGWESEIDARERLAALGATLSLPDWRHRLGTSGPVLAKTARDQLLVWMPAHGYYMGFQFDSQEVQRREEGVQLLIWEGRLSDVASADDLRAYVAGGGSLLILVSPQAYNDLDPPVLSGAAGSLDVTLDWLLPAFGMGLSHRVRTMEQPALLHPVKRSPSLTLSEPSYLGTYFPLEGPRDTALLHLQQPSQIPPETVAAVDELGLGRVAVVSLQNWFPTRNIWAAHTPPWQSQLMQGVMDWLSTPGAELPPQAAEHWAAARGLVSTGDYGAAVQELDKVETRAPSGRDARYWAGGLLADKLGNIDGAVRRWREVISARGADAWLIRMAHLRLGVAGVRAGDERTAVPELQVAAGDQPDGIWGQAWIASGDLSLAQGDLLGAAQTFRKVADELGHSAERCRALFGLAYALAKQSKLEASARIYEALVVEFGNARLPDDLDRRWPDPWWADFPREKRASDPRVANAVAWCQAASQEVPPR